MISQKAIQSVVCRRCGNPSGRPTSVSRMGKGYRYAYSATLCDLCVSYLTLVLDTALAERPGERP